MNTMQYTPEIPPEILALKDPSLATAAREAAEAARLKMLAAEEAVKAAAEHVKAAEAARAELVMAAASDPSAAKSRRAAESRLDEAKRAEQFAREVAEAASQAFQAASANIRPAERESWRPVMNAGAAIRLAAAQRCAELKGQLRRAEEFHAMGCAAVEKAAVAGCEVAVMPAHLRRPQAYQQPWLDNLAEQTRPREVDYYKERKWWGSIEIPPAAAELIQAAGYGSDPQ